ncbi:MULTISPECIES: GNAT family N-acetyltransferase [unclassified Streptomyces]|uniref:GNAT family N-acetyltransferase n=1 Tax=unclassified Streptomyces TaxID=2593676 RepID=UPI0022576815|nr:MULTISPECIES: GNAT family N-acetyltransferase [unclassified Streptomyces]MCX5140824.1 GNAT family N-acetyltransferase [Streptomyces sp. NBC_00338]
MTIDVRPYAPFDLPGMYRVCLRTGDSGRDATALYRDPDLLPHVYAGPYPAADPGLTFVAHDAHGLLGYVVATADTPAFDAWLEENWWPGLRHRYPGPLATDPGDGSQDWRRVAHIHHPDPPEPDALFDRYPAHLHIDILPRGQGTGLGRRLMTTLLEALRERGVRGVHLGVGGGNPGARAFYLKVGFTEHDRQEWGSVMVRDLTR